MKYNVCVMPNAKGGFGIVSEAYYEAAKFKCEIVQTGTFEEVYSAKKYLINNK